MTFETLTFNLERNASHFSSFRSRDSKNLKNKVISFFSSSIALNAWDKSGFRATDIWLTFGSVRWGKSGFRAIDSWLTFGSDRSGKSGFRPLTEERCGLYSHVFFVSRHITQIWINVTKWFSVHYIWFSCHGNTSVDVSVWNVFHNLHKWSFPVIENS